MDCQVFQGFKGILRDFDFKISLGILRDFKDILGILSDFIGF